MPYCQLCSSHFDLQHVCTNGNGWCQQQQTAPQYPIGYPGIQQQYTYNVPSYITDILNRLDRLQKDINELKKNEDSK